LIRALIAAETPARPLTDDELVAALAARGYQLSWTAGEPHPIASYRRVLGIADPVSRRRGT
jgi:DNA-directed RNA polymerase specialized sigma54-like protein